jgi:TRAP-type uncharacterized transport system fused permease subunit
LTGTYAQNAAAIVSATVGAVLFSIMSTGYFYIKTNLIEWLLLAAATALAFVPAIATGLTAISVFAVVFLWQRKRAASLLKESQSVEIAMK